MKIRLNELKNLMGENGLDESAALAQNILDGMNPTGKTTEINYNSNANCKKRKVEQSTSSQRNNAQIIPSRDQSEVTIYRSAVKRVGNNEDSNLSQRLSTSSEEEEHNISDEIEQVRQMFTSFPGNRNRGYHDAEFEDGKIDCRQRHDVENEYIGQSSKPKQVTPEDRSEKLLRETEAAKGRVYGTTGIVHKEKNNPYKLHFTKERIHSMLVDEEYSAIGSHLDESMIEKIKSRAYVDFSKLLPRDRLAIEEDNRLQPIVKDGQVFWQPPADNLTVGNISSYYRWEQAFKVYSNIYTRAHPHRASELIQYSHDIHAASLTFV